MRRLLVLTTTATTLALWGCGTSQKSAERAAKPTSSTHEAEAVPQPPEAKPIDTSRSSQSSLDKKYLGLQGAVRAGQGEQIIEQAAKVLASNPSDPFALNALAMYHFRRGKVGAARLLLSRAFEKNTPSAALHNNFGLIQLADGEESSAIESFKKALRLDDKHAEALGNLGSIYAVGGDFARAQPLLEQSYHLNPTNPVIAVNYAVTLSAAKLFAQAAKIYEDILRADSKNVNAAFDYAVLLINYLNRPKDGLAWLYKVKLFETERKDILEMANELEKKARSGIK